MHNEALVGLLDELAGTEVSVAAGVVTVGVPAIGDAVRVAMRDVLGFEQIIVPTGAPGLELGIRRGHEELPLIVTVDDVAFMPAYAADMLVPGARLEVPAMPHMVMYSEMHRDVRALGRAIDDEDLDLDLGTLAATLLVHRCFLAGAVRVGLWPVRVAAWWEYMWARVGARLPLDPFRPDPVWDRLMADVTEARRLSAQPAHRDQEVSRGS
ncbi:hypothetical protein Asp14428_76870 [Actinoplanes sp. NBRC 14428]|uniref:Uncharacterized protein n=1 Tax=Pseudosporangium ferrugineum TaxID=439699 RepID=A0A2T0RX42_9ACTN|nr:hypothetical protein [Pseudosporangium ferrugineum]PRY25741.1 hypothetical protein CLV70_112107 [Pseudosporangium ferrugineum]BCJ56212.1 hypothetical protein Asp14428_76870 [Actinoplanes sp. NBRC 14428]